MRKVSAVLPVHNHGRFVGEAVESALSQTYPAVEVIVVDDASADGTAEVLASFGDSIRVVHNLSNQGVASARNAGAAAGSGDVLAFIDADDVWLPNKLERQMELLAQRPEVALVHCGVEDIDADGQRLAEHRAGLDGWVADKMLSFDGFAILGGGSAAIVTREVFESIGRFDERLSTSADWDLYCRVATRHQIGFVDEILVKYRIHADNMHTDIDAMEHDMLLAFEKAFDDPSVAALERGARGNLHRALAGSYVDSGHAARGAVHALKSLRLTPQVLLRVPRASLNRLGSRRPSPRRR